jgi:hypothetical protein
VVRNGSSEIRDLIDQTPWIDTHEHLVEETDRLKDGTHHFRQFDGGTHRIPADWTSLIVDYTIVELRTAGMPSSVEAILLGSEHDPAEKWDAVAPFFSAARNTGYLRAVDLTTERLCGLRLSRATCAEIDVTCRALRRPGYYHTVLRDLANVERCQVHTADLLDDPFRETATPDLIDADLSLYPLVTGRHPRAEELSGIEVCSFEDYLEVVEWCFDTFASRAIAAKCLWAYFRTLEVEDSHPSSEAFARVRRGEASRHERRQVEDAIFLNCIELARIHGLPVKLHVGYLDGTHNPQASRISGHVNAVASLAQRHPGCTFVLMHMGWPNQEAAMAVAKHMPNVVIDLCWSWIVSPASTRDFVRRFLTTVPASKLMCFGGDYTTVEPVIGHAEIARRGLAGSLEQLILDEWLTAKEALALVRPLMRGNATRVFRYEAGEHVNVRGGEAEAAIESGAARSR